MTTIASSFHVVRRWSNWGWKTNSPTMKMAMTTAEIAQSVANDLTVIVEIAVETVADAHHAAEVAAVAEAAVVAEAVVVAADAVAVAAAEEVVEAAAVEVAAVADAKT